MTSPSTDPDRQAWWRRQLDRERAHWVGQGGPFRILVAATVVGGLVATVVGGVILAAILAVPWLAGILRSGDSASDGQPETPAQIVATAGEPEAQAPQPEAPDPEAPDPDEPDPEAPEADEPGNNRLHPPESPDANAGTDPNAGTDSNTGTDPNAVHRASASTLGPDAEFDTKHWPRHDLTDGIDYYTFTLTQRRAISLGLRHYTIDIDLFLEDGDGKTIASSTLRRANGADQQDWEQIGLNLDPGTYYLRVQGVEPGTTEYTLRWGPG